MEKSSLQKNADRFTGFADIYDSVRPKVPGYPVKVISWYLGRTPRIVVDLGCGTGLSTLIWGNVCDQVIGIEPSEDMLIEAKKKENSRIHFIKAFAHDTGLQSGIADAVICSQSFHWMEPKTTLREVGRILKPGGVFAAIDCDWPPVCNRKAEQAFNDFRAKVNRLEYELPEVKDSFVRYRKSEHLQNIKDSGQFCYCREIVFSNTEPCTAERFVNLQLSQGNLQGVLKTRPELIEADFAQYREKIFNIFGDRSFEIDFSYRMRIGIKANKA